MRLKPQLYLFVVVCAVAMGAPATAETATAKESTGVQTPGVQIPAAKLVAEKEFKWAPAWLFFDGPSFDGKLMGPASDGHELTVIDMKSLEFADSETGFDAPCAGAITAFKSLWVMNCGTGEIIRLNPTAKAGEAAPNKEKTAEAQKDEKKESEGKSETAEAAEAEKPAETAEIDRIQAKIPAGVGKTAWGIASTDDSIWAFTDNKTTLSRIDPAGNRVVGELRVPAGCDQLLAAANALWVTCPSRNELLKINPELNIVDKHIKVAKHPTSLMFAGGALWLLGLEEGKINKIDPKDVKITETIELKAYNSPTGGIAFGDGSLWASVPGFPLTRIDPDATDGDEKKPKVMQQFVGKGGGAVYFGSGALWMVNEDEGTLWKIDPKRILATVAD